MRKSDFNFMDPTLIVYTVISLIIIVAGVFSFFTIWAEVGDDDALSHITTETKSQVITDPSIDQTMSLPSDAEIVSVTESLNDGSTNTIGSGDYSFSDGTLTVTVTG